MSDEYQIIPDLSGEFFIQASRSRGPGGQNVNKVNSKIELRFNIKDSLLLTEEQKQALLKKLSAKISSDGFLIVISQGDRSQLINRQDAIRKINNIIIKSLQPAKRRKRTQPTKSSIEKRLAEKRIKADIKQTRQKIDD